MVGMRMKNGWYAYERWLVLCAEPLPFNVLPHAVRQQLLTTQKQ